MDIGSAKVTNDEMNGVPHYLIDEVKPDYSFSVSEFQDRANNYIEKITEKGKTALVTGGTGLYLNSLIYNMDFAKSDANNELREKLTLELQEHGIDYMHEKLRFLDEDTANRIHKNNTKRVIRALEVCLSGEKMNDFSNDLKFNEKYNPIIIVLNREREHLYQRINKRVDIMMDGGLVDEVKKLLSLGYTKDMISMQGIGYKEIIKYLEGEYSLDEAVEIIKRDSRRYAKRQLTWFRRYNSAKWFNLDEYSDKEVLEKEIFNTIEKML
jgi:tRNA dimethylallyltransferase